MSQCGDWHEIRERVLRIEARMNPIDEYDEGGYALHDCVELLVACKSLLRRNDELDAEIDEIKRNLDERGQSQ